MRLMIFDPHERGHYLTYVRHMLRGAAIAEHVTVVLQEGVTESAPYRIQLSPYVGSVEVAPIIRRGVYTDGRRLLEDFHLALRRYRPDHVWVPSGDRLVRRSNLSSAVRQWRFPTGVECEGGMIDIDFHRSPRRWRGHVRHLIERTLMQAGPWDRIHTIDPTVYTWVRAHGGRLARKFELLPDPVDEFTAVSKQEARRVLAIPQGGRYIGAVGAHAHPRKGTDLLLEAFSLARLASNDRLLLAGPLGENLQRRIKSEFSHLFQSERIIVLDRYLTDEELMTALSAMDLVCTPYFEHFGSSGIVLRAAQLGRPVLAPHQGWFAKMIPRFELGDTGEILNTTALANELPKSLEHSTSFCVSAACQRLIEYSHPANFACHWAVRIRQRLGFPLENNLRTWNWVLQ